MIPQAHITEWSQQVPWQTPEQVELDLVICRSLVEIFSDELLRNKLAFRGGTALHKLYLHPQPRFSEDIDLVQLHPEPIKDTIDRIRSVMSFLGEPTVKMKGNGFQIIYRFYSEFPPIVGLRLKIETNTREHFHIKGIRAIPFEVDSSWYRGKCKISSFSIEELLGTKLRALYQRRKGRDLFDLFSALSQKPELNLENVLECYRAYIEFSTNSPPSRKTFLLNMEAKMQDDDFLGDTTALLRPTLAFNPEIAFDLVKAKLINLI